jgi:hypothetical protein
MKYIFCTGAPGSTWSGIAKRIYWSPDVDQSDYIVGDREYSGESPFPVHTGAYWDPGMEFEVGDWNTPFTGDGFKLIKCHSIATDLHLIKDIYPTCPIVMVWRDNLSCYRWWHKAGGWNISYPDYRPFYRDNHNLKLQIQKQNSGILEFVQSNIENITEVSSPLDINKVLGIKDCPELNPIYPIENLRDINNNNNKWVGSNIKMFVYTP